MTRRQLFTLISGIFLTSGVKREKVVLGEPRYGWINENGPIHAKMRRRYLEKYWQFGKNYGMSAATFNRRVNNE